MTDEYSLLAVRHNVEPLKSVGYVRAGVAVMASTAASIPSKYQTLVIDNCDNKGFLSKSKRFNYDLSAVIFYYGLLLMRNCIHCVNTIMNESYIDVCLQRNHLNKELHGQMAATTCGCAR